jgi:two-component system, LytTR family, sensor kinase
MTSDSQLRRTTHVASRSPDNSLLRDLRPWPLYFGLWTLVGLFYYSENLTQRLLGQDRTPWWYYLLAWLVEVYIWAFLTPVMLWLGRRFPLERGNWLPRVGLHLLLSAAFSVFEITLESAIYPQIGIFPMQIKSFRNTFPFLLARGFQGGILTYWAVLGVQWGIQYYRWYQERTQEALDLELRASELRTQLMSAQFLFNTLNAIMVLVRQQNSRAAEEMLSHLSDLLRCVLEDVEAQEVPLRRELHYLRLYLSIEQVRFPDRLRVEVSADHAVQDAAVPQFALQPIVENAIRHGIGASGSAGKIVIIARRVGDTLEIRVEDDGPGLARQSDLNEKGIGLTNTRARLEQLYGSAARLTLQNAEGGGAAVTMILPFHTAIENAQPEMTEVDAL